MTLTGFLLVLTAAFCHATWNFFVKRINGGPELVWLFSLLSVLIYMPLAIWVLIVEQPVFGRWELLFLIGSVFLHLAYFLLLQTGYRKGDLSVVYPTARATGPFLSTCFAVVLLGESLTPQIAVGGLAIIAGVVCLTGGIRAARAGATASILFGLAAGVLIASYTVWDAYTVATLAVPALLLDYASSLGRVFLLAPIALKRRARVQAHWRDHRGGVIVIAVFNSLAYILVLYALTFTPVVYVAPVREVSVLLTVLAGSILLGEGNLKMRLLWAMLISAGVALLATG